ncbi:Bardet-Biedl syndrome 1 protein isoform X3 [Galleria mellonella]|nr:Bardet-Biedl syndrome 1 protein isoform X3 [Galleria mellonella]XP_052751922.1 Bardet-Biedl syndrome 1 protein isoform X3 [Galleria mellonella]XP_052751961.1 Bardet-Biedl syndrome 1 protein isoform X3 [Galleria mellonella]XP_052752006.1 Bardet-Biedl syndrome 1 protein isoform X3 [Galleria mellonella]XP_052752061.1 Bardet-Biedl syndrome 1 protein isoform X3 [Galleria mellonella]XP_052752092.1 Bardet-Biedl syndrome 1 protein isoform X3 [Galleria mellonella]
MQVSDMVLPDLPLGVVGFYTNETVPRSQPVIGIAFSSCIHMYRNMKIFYKYYLPTVEFNTCEMEVWKQLMDPLNHNTEVIAALTESFKSIPEKVLSTQSRNFLAMSEDQQLEYLEHLTELPSRKVPEIACIATLKMQSVDRYSVSCLVVGSEDGEVIVLETQTFTQIAQAKVCTVKKTPCYMVTTGLFNVDYRITIATREKSVCVLKREWPEGRLLFSTDEHIIAMEVMTADNSIMVICTDHTMACYSKKGKKQWSMNLEHRPVAMTLVPVVHLGVTLTAVALASGHVHLYDGKARRDTLFVRDVVSVMKFGQLGQEEHVLIIVTGGGNLMLKILKRTADFNAHSAGVEATASAAIAQKPWLIPKKSKLFLEQSLRERENAGMMHEVFQLELNRLRLLAAKTLLEAHMKCDNSIGSGAMEPVRLTAEVEGLGPVFRVGLIIENTSSDKAVIGLSILFHVHTSNYKVSHPYIKVPLISPGSKLKFPTKVEEVFEENINPDVFFRTVTGQGGEAALVKVLLLKHGRSAPVLAATVQMPPTDPMMLPYEKLQSTQNFEHNT